MIALLLSASCSLLPWPENYYKLTAKVDEFEIADIACAQMDDYGMLYFSSYRSRALMKWSESTGLRQYFDFNDAIVSLSLGSTGKKLYAREGMNLWEIDTPSNTKTLVRDDIAAESEGIGVAGDFLVVASVEDIDATHWEGLLLIRRSDFAEADRLDRQMVPEEYAYIDNDQMLLVAEGDDWDQNLAFIEIDQGTGTFGSEILYSRWSPPFDDMIPGYVRLSHDQRYLLMVDGSVIGVNAGDLQYEGTIHFDDSDIFIRDVCFFGNALIVLSGGSPESGASLTVHSPTPAFTQTKENISLYGTGSTLFVCGEYLYVLVEDDSAYITEIYKFDTSICE